jgi:hypothetical protein
MATDVQHKRWASAGFASIFLFGGGVGVGACGEASRGNSPDAGADLDGDVGGIESLLADLEDDVAGLPCREDGDCAGKNARCSPGIQTDAVRSCTGLCEDDDQCGAGGTCVEVARLGTQTLSFCQKTCTDHDDCDEQLQCSQSFNAYEVIVSISNALRGAEVFMPSDPPTICQEELDTVQMENGAVGLACEPDAECGGGTCNTRAAFFPNGYCSGKCTEHEQCGVTGACVRDIASETLGLPGACLRKCLDHSECRQDEGYGCWPLPFLLAVDAAAYCLIERPREGTPGFLFPGPGEGAAADAGAP